MLQLQIDELQEALGIIEHPAAAAFERALCGLADAMAAEIAKHYGIGRGPASQQGKAFAGLCVPFRPLWKGQPMPEELGYFDDGGAEDWEEEAERLLTVCPEAVAPWVQAKRATLQVGERVQCKGGIECMGIVDSLSRMRGGLVTVEYDDGTHGAWTFESLYVLKGSVSDLAKPEPAPAAEE